jgi:LacI family repressor for deo operon, udp, cdd, tsx, nupC, and nupG
VPVPRRPTIADVARRAGVSPAAVSFTVNDRPGVSDETRDRIRSAAQELGWRPSASARALTESRARAIGLILHRDPAALEMDAFFVRFLSGIERALASRDCALLLQLLPAGTADRGAYERLAAAGRVDGFLLTDIEHGDPRLDVLTAADMPAVIAGRPDEPCPFPWIETEHGPGMAAAARHLVELGHTRIGFFGAAAELRFVQERERHWRGALEAPGPVAYDDPAPLLDAASPSSSSSAAPLTAVACTSDALALSLISAARERGLRVPDDLSVTGFDDSPLAQLSSPALTSVRIDYADYGAAAAAALLDAIEGGAAAGYSGPPPQLIVRASTAAPGP